MELSYPIIPDISFWQDDPTTPMGVDFKKMRMKSQGVIIRAGQWTWIDPDFDDHWKRSKEAGLLRGSYWYYDNRGDPRKQAERYVSILGNDAGELGLWCDFEDRNNITTKPLWDAWYNFIERIKDLRPDVKIGVYTGYYYFQEFAMGQKYFAQYPLWIAWYGEKPKIPPIWDDWTMWQFTSSGNGFEYGVESKEIDLNECKLPLGKPVKETWKMVANFEGTEVLYDTVQYDPIRKRNENENRPQYLRGCNRVL